MDLLEEVHVILAAPRAFTSRRNHVVRIDGLDDAEIAVENVSDHPAFPVTVDLENDEQRFFASENFFMLMPREKKTVRITCDKGEIGNVKVSLWNGTPITI